MAVAQFRDLFLRLCDEYHVEPEEALLEEMRRYFDNLLLLHQFFQKVITFYFINIYNFLL